MHQARRRWAALAGSALRTNSASTKTSPDVSTAISEVFRVQAIGRRGIATGVTKQVKQQPTRGWTRRLGTLLLGTGVVGAAAWVANGEHPVRRATMLYSVPVRLARDVSTAVAMIADYKYALYGLAEGSTEREVARHEAHLRCANRLQALCFKNGGIYIKLGQHIGQLDYLLPEEYVKIMRASMLDKCPVSTYKQVCDVFMAELGRLPHEVFEEFDRVPLASASLAQVHTAKSFAGQKLAVKVQHMHLTDSAMADTATVDFIVSAVHFLFPSFDYRWLLAEVRESLPKELDFLNEGKNCEKSLENFKKLSPKLAPQISVPHMYWELSTQRILTMEYMDGVGVTDVQAIKALGLRPADVARLVSQTFAEMIFRHGFVHCDPHAANMMVRVRPGSREPQLVLLDHGLYKTLDPVIQSNYAGLWKALVFADSKEIKEHCIGLGAGDDLYALFAAILTMRPWNKIVDPSIDHLIVPDTLEERQELQGYASQYFWEVSALLARLPRVVLLLLKTNDCLRAVDNALGAPINTYLIVARTSSKAVSEMERKGLFSQVWMLWDKLDLEFRLLTWKASALLIGIKHYMKYIGFS